MAGGGECDNQYSSCGKLSLSQKKIGLVGRNGIGKTTLLRLLVDELEPTSGEIKRSGKIAYLFGYNIDWRLPSPTANFG